MIFARFRDFAPCLILIVFVDGCAIAGKGSGDSGGVGSGGHATISLFSVIISRGLEAEDRIFSPEDPTVVDLQHQAKDASEAGRFNQAETLLTQAANIDLNAAEHMEEARDKRLLSAAASKAGLGELKMVQFAYLDSAEYYKQTVGLVPDGSDLVRASYLNGWGWASIRAGDYRTAESAFQKSLVIRKKLLGEEHWDVARTLHNLAVVYYAQGHYTKAEPLYQQSLIISEKVFGGEDSHTATILSNFANLYSEQGRYTKAEPLYQRALAILEKALGEEHPEVVNILTNYAVLLRDIQRNAEAEKLEARAKVIYDKHTQDNQRQ